MRFAAIDVGTNTTRLLVAEATGDGYRDLDRRLTFTRLGEGVDAAGDLSKKAVERTLGAVAEFCSASGEFGVKMIRIAATSAVRDAANRAAVMDGMRRLSGVEPELLDGDREAQLSFLGAVHDLPEGEYLVCDIGGGSTEFLRGSRRGQVAASRSLNIGAVRLTERYLRSDPHEESEIEQMESEIARALDDARDLFLQDPPVRFVGVAGTVTTLAALKLALPKYDPGRTHHLVLTFKEIERLNKMMSNMSLEERLRLPALPAGRADVIVAGASILQAAMRLGSFREVVVSEKDILDGLILEMTERR